MRQLYLLPRDVGIDHLRLSAGTSTSPSLSVFLRNLVMELLPSMRRFSGVKSYRTKVVRPIIAGV